MQRLTLLITLAAVLALLAGCSESPRAVGVEMAEKHLEVGLEPSPSQQARMRSEFQAKAAEYSMAQQREFAKGYMDVVLTRFQERMAGQRGQAMNHASRELPPRQ